MTDTLTDTITIEYRAALVAYYERRRVQAQRIAADAQTEADAMAVMGNTVRILGDAAVTDEYQRLVTRD